MNTLGFVDPAGTVGLGRVGGKPWLDVVALTKTAKLVLFTTLAVTLDMGDLLRADYWDDARLRQDRVGCGRPGLGRGLHHAVLALWLLYERRFDWSHFGNCCQQRGYCRT